MSPHGVDVGERVGRRDPPEVEGIVHHRHEEVGRRHQRLLVVQPPHRCIVAGLGSDHQVGERGRDRHLGQDAGQHARRELAAATAAMGKVGQADGGAGGDVLHVRGSSGLGSPLYQRRRRAIMSDIEVIERADGEDAGPVRRHHRRAQPLRIRRRPRARRDQPARAERRRARRGRDDLRAGVALPRPAHRRGADRPQHRPLPGGRAGRQARRFHAADLLLARRPALGRHGDHPLAGRLADDGARRRLQDLPPPRPRQALRRRLAAGARPARGTHGLRQDRDPRPPRRARRADAGPGGAGRASRLGLRRRRPRAAEPEDVRVPPAGGARGSRPRAPGGDRGGVEQDRRPHDPARALEGDDRRPAHCGRRARSRRAPAISRPTTPTSSPTAQPSTQRWSACRSSLAARRLAAWRALADAGDLVGLAADLVGNHYDPAYDRSNRKDPRPRLATLEMPGLEGVDQEAAADAIVRSARSAASSSSGASAAQSRSAPAGKS